MTSETILNSHGDTQKFLPHSDVKNVDDIRTPAELIDPQNWQGKKIPDRRWIVDNWLPYSHVTALYGDGGTGKSLLTMMLSTALSLGRKWLGIPVSQVRVLCLFCEDTEDELHRRQSDINQYYDCNFSDLNNLRYISGVGKDNILIDFAEGRATETQLYDYILSRALEFGAKLVVIDTAADTFGGNENSRGQVRQFINALNRIAIEIDGAVLLCAHPSVAGMASGKGDGGNTAWSNTLRSRMYLTRPKPEDSFDNSDIRILSRKKANYASVGEEISLVWNDGIFHLQSSSNLGVVDAISKRNQEKQIEAAFLLALDDFERQGRNLSSSNKSGNYAPKMMLYNSHCAGFRKKELHLAMERLFDRGIVREEQYGRPSNPCKKIVKTGEKYERNGYN